MFSIHDNKYVKIAFGMKDLREGLQMTHIIPNQSLEIKKKMRIMDSKQLNAYSSNRVQFQSPHPLLQMQSKILLGGKVRLTVESFPPLKLKATSSTLSMKI